MNHDLQVELVRRFFRLRAAGTTDLAPSVHHNPASDYTDPDQLALERRLLFREGPILAGLSGDAPEAGDYFTLDGDGIPLLVVRGEDRVRAFVNACRHRGSRVAEGRGRLESSITCPYHAWTYDRHGQLLHQPGAQGGFAELDTSTLGLRQVPVGEGRGLVFVRGGGNPNDQAVDVDAVLAGAGPELGAYGLEHYRHVETRERVRTMNWKMVIDTFLEAYHIFSLHKASIASHYFSSPALFDEFGPNHRFVGLRRSILELEGKPEDEWSLLPHATIHYVLVPNALVVHQLDHLEVWQVFPVADQPGQARILTSLYAPEAPATDRAWAHWRKNLDILIGVTDNEDFPQCEAIQASLESGVVPELIFGRNEPALIHFHRSVRKLIGLDS